MVVEFIKGIVSYLRALTFVSRAGLGRYFVYSGLIGLGLMTLSISIVYYTHTSLGAWLVSLIPWDIGILNQGVGSWITVIFSSIFFLTIFKYLMLIFTAPLMSDLSAKVESYIDGDTDRRTSLRTMGQELIRGLRISLRNIIREIAITIFLFILGFVPVVGVLSTAMIMLVQSYFAGFGNIDFWAERQFNYRDTLKFMPRHKGMLTANGLIYILLLAIPLVGVFIAPPLATIAGTLQAHDYKTNRILTS